jgi:hypothetical protein
MLKPKKNGKHRHQSSKGKVLKAVPDFKSIQEEAHFWDTHDTTEYALEDLEETIEVAGPLKARIEKRRAERLATLLKLDPKQLHATLKIARQRGISSSALIKSWIDEGLRRESTRA